jgi:hypothetical protein
MIIMNRIGLFSFVVADSHGGRPVWISQSEPLLYPHDERAPAISTFPVRSAEEIDLGGPVGL